jgi:hypothetical protein
LSFTVPSLDGHSYDLGDAGCTRTLSKHVAVNFLAIRILPPESSSPPTMTYGAIAPWNCNGIAMELQSSAVTGLK